MKRKRVIKIFVGYQIKSKYHNPEKLKNTFKNLKRKFSTKTKFDLDVKFGEFPAGKILYTEVLRSITQCNIAILDISENNTNVLIEVGMALGLNKPVFLLKNKVSKKKFRIPTDIKPFIYVPYKNSADIDSNDTVNLLFNPILTNYQEQIHEPKKCFESFWGFNNFDHVYVICPELDDPELLQTPEPDEFLYLSKYGDIDSILAVIKSLARLYPDLKITFCTGNEFESYPRSSYTENMILIGGPDYNKIYEIFMSESNFEYKNRKGNTVLINKNNKKVYKHSKIAHNGIEEGMDYGVFLKKVNPRNKNKKLIMIHGIHTYGVYGTAKCFSSLDLTDDISLNNCKTVIDKLGEDPEFEIILKVKSTNRIIDTPQIENNDILPIYKKSG